MQEDKGSNKTGWGTGALNKKKAQSLNE